MAHVPTTVDLIPPHLKPTLSHFTIKMLLRFSANLHYVANDISRYYI